MRKFLTTIVAILGIIGMSGSGLAAEKRGPSSTTWSNAQGQKVTGNWSSGEIVEIKTVEEYHWHLEHYDPSKHYDVAPWLYDSKNLVRESGGDAKD